MKKNLLRLIIMSTKYSLYGFVISCMMLTSLMAANSHAQEIKSVKEVRVKLAFDQVTLMEAFNKIEQATNFHFIFNDYEIDQTLKISTSYQRGQMLSDLLLDISRQANVQFKQVNKNISVKRLPEKEINNISDIEVIIQTRTITGKVTSMEDDEGLPGVNVVEKGTTNGTVTDVQGEYSLEVSEGATLVFSSVGYTQEEVEVGNRSTIDLAMAQDIQQLQELVVVGYGTIKRSDVTGAVASLDKQKLEDLPNTNFAQAIQGAMPGVNVTNVSANAEGNQEILLRGKNSITANNTPLIVIDGVPYNGALSEINQRDIESIDILRDASSAAIYGARGSNGVILITTKKGIKGAPRISYDGYYGVQEASDIPQIMNGEQFYQFKLERERNNANDQTLTPEQAFTDSELEVYQNGEATDWIDEATRLGSQQQHDLNVSGGSENIQYYVSGSILDVEGIAKNDDFRRITGRINVSASITDWLQLGTNTQVSEADRSGDPASFGGAFYMNPLTRGYTDEGELTLFPWPEDVFSNPLGNLNNIRDDKLLRIFTNNYLDVKLNFLPGLSYRLNTGFNYRNRNIGRYQGRNTVAGFTNGGVATVTNGVTKDILVENILAYTKDFGDHSLNFTGLYSFQKINDESHETESQGFPNDVMSYYQPGLGTLIQPSSTYAEQNYISYMGRINYSFKNKYLITLTGRRDGYSAFGADQKFGFFPSVALGWQVGEEPFMQNVEYLDLLKLRVSYGENGNQAIDPYTTLAQMSADAYLGGPDGQTILYGFYPSALGTSNLGWETTKSLNIGVDFGLFNNRLQGNIDYYVANTYDLLLNRTISPVHGASTSILQNIGETRNSGVELLLTSININQNGFKWSTNLNFTINRNEIVDLYGDGQDDIANRWFIGKPIDVNFDHVIDGVWQSDDDIENGPQPDAMPGDVKIKDTNDDGVIDNLDREIIGSLQPSYIAGITNDLTYKNFNLNFFIHTVQGVTKQNTLLQPNEVWPDTRRNAVYRTDYWTPENGGNTYPANREFTNNLLTGFYEDASFVRLRDISLSYNFDLEQIQKIGLSNLRVYFNIRNALTITKWSALDPELGSQRSIPLNRVYLLGLRLGI